MPFGDQTWTSHTVKKFSLDQTMRGVGRLTPFSIFMNNKTPSVWRRFLYMRDRWLLDGFFQCLAYAEARYGACRNLNLY